MDFNDLISTLIERQDKIPQFKAIFVISADVFDITQTIALLVCIFLYKSSISDIVSSYPKLTQYPEINPLRILSSIIFQDELWKIQIC